MRRLGIFLLSFSLLYVVSVLSSAPALASHQEDVLGIASETTLSIPPTTEGPGLVLPNSPLFFLDRIKQEFRLLLAFTPEQKAKIHNAVAGERLAELQLMLAKNNVSGIRIALQGVSDNSREAAKDLSNAKLTGRNINLLTKEINDSIKEKQRALSALELQATGEIRAQVRAAREALKIAKVSIEENLPEDLMANETIDDLNQQIADSISSASLSAAEINRAVGVLTKISSNAANVSNQSELTNLTNQFRNAEMNMQKGFPTDAPAKSVKK